MEQIILWLVVVPIGYAVWYFIKRKNGTHLQGPSKPRTRRR